MSFTTKTQTSVFNYSFNDLMLQRVSDYKYLGVIFTTNLSWSKHINSVCTKSLKKLGYLRRTLRTSPYETKLLMYKTLIRPVLDYASIVWCPYKKREIKQIESVQKKAIRFICRRYDHHFSPTSAITTLNLTSLSTRRDIESLKFLHAIVHSVNRLSDNSYLTYAMPTVTRNNHALNLAPFHAHTNLFKFSFFPRTIEQWNLLPGEIRSASINQFLPSLESRI